MPCHAVARVHMPLHGACDVMCDVRCAMTWLASAGQREARSLAPPSATIHPMPKHAPTDTARWQPIADGVWSLTHHFRNLGMPISTRMSVMRLADGSLLAHSSVPLTAAQRAQLDGFGPLRAIVAPNAVHHLFIGNVLAHYPDCAVYGPPSLRAKRPDLPTLQDWPVSDAHAAKPAKPLSHASAPWAPAVSLQPLAGIPRIDEAACFHHPSGTLFMADICQCWTGPLSAPVRLYLGLTGGRDRLTVPRTIRLLAQDKAALKASAQAVLAWPIQRIVLLHNSVIEHDAQSALAEAFSIWD